MAFEPQMMALMAESASPMMVSTTHKAPTLDWHVPAEFLGHGGGGGQPQPRRRLQSPDSPDISRRGSPTDFRQASRIGLTSPPVLNDALFGADQANAAKPPATDKYGFGCATTGAPAPWAGWLAMLAILGLRRRC